MVGDHAAHPRDIALERSGLERRLRRHALATPHVTLGKK
jgi:hypothetical protein